MIDNDKLLLKKAAKAAGITWTLYSDVKGLYRNSYYDWWNPLTDDGDALRLAVKLRLTVSWDRYDDVDYATATPPDTYQGYDCIVDQDPYAATRRAIVRAAAQLGTSVEIGKDIKQHIVEDGFEDNYYKSLAEAETLERSRIEKENKYDLAD